MPKLTTHPLALAKWKFAKHRAQSKYRGIEFNFSFKEWYDWWLSNGIDKNIDIKWVGPERPCMCRKGDDGPYEINNVYFATNSENTKEKWSLFRSGKLHIIDHFDKYKYRTRKV